MSDLEKSADVAVRYDAWHEHRNQAEGYRESAAPLHSVWHQMVLPRLPELGGLSVAEIGCGRGDLAVALARQGAQVTAVDFSEAAIRIARTRAAHEGAPVDWRVADAQQTGLSPNAYQLVVSCECLEHVPEPSKMVAELFRICAPGGRCILTTPSYLNGMAVAWLHSLVTRRAYNSGSGAQPHENFFLYFRIASLLKRAGFLLQEMDSRIFQFLLLPRVDPARLRVVDFGWPILNRVFRPFGLHFVFVLRKPESAGGSCRP